MKRALIILAASTLILCAGCNHRHAKVAAVHAKAYGVTLVMSSGNKQLGTPGTLLPQPVVVEVDDQNGNTVQGALVQVSGTGGVHVQHAQGLTDEDGLFTTQVTLGNTDGRYDLTAVSSDKKGKQFKLKLVEFAAAYQQRLGYELNVKYCSRCHDPESTSTQVSNYGNLAVDPHTLSDGASLNKLSDAELTSIIQHGGPALNRSALMPPYDATLNKADIKALIAYIRLIADPPYRTAGVVYEQK
ncbi:MAG TPA: c-type cytochrome [Acidobacteriaceae bacterium]|nr:c-type cytochrome [Acidobacteriaceae bacterium]